MSETSESYEDLVKQLKPLSVVLTRIPKVDYLKLKVVDDPNAIKDEKPIQPVAEEEEEEVEEEIELDLTELETNANNNPKEVDLREFSCFFCHKKTNGFDENFTHLQHHIDYYPVQCSVCDEANTDVKTFVKHCREVHPELETAKYIHKYNAICFNWINDFLNNQMKDSVIKESLKTNPQKYCPACDWIHLSGDVNNPSDSMQIQKPMKILRHIHEHINYLPFSCSICRENGGDFRLHVLDFNTRMHFTTVHKDFQTETPFWKLFSKKFTIPSIDKFIANYLSIFGIKMPKNRFKKKKSKPVSNVIDLDPVVVQTNNNFLSTATKETTIVVNQRGQVLQKLLPKQAVTLESVLIPTLNQPVLNGNLQIVTYSKMESLFAMESPLLIYPSNDKINMRPIPVESTDIGIVCVDPNTIEVEDRLFKYMCVFCAEEISFYSSIEAAIHYALHFDYNPVICMLCDKKFIDFSTLISHYNQNHSEYKNNLFHYLKEDQRLEDWMNGFIAYQKTHEFNAYVSVIYGDYCFVCEKLAKNQNGIQIKCEKSNAKGIRDHIRQHLHYFPYKCSICFHGGRDVRFTSVNRSAFEHLLKIHGLNVTDPKILSQFSKLFAKCDEILDLEKFIDKKMFPNKDIGLETPLVLNLKRKLEEIETENRKRLETTGNRTVISGPLSTLPSAQVSPIVREVSINNTVLNQMLTQIPNTNQKQMVINSIKFVPKSMSTPSVKPIEFIPTKNTFMESFLLCFHCHQRVKNTTELESHHQSKHPKLTIASYAPTKRDLISLT